MGKFTSALLAASNKWICILLVLLAMDFFLCNNRRMITSEIAQTSLSPFSSGLQSDRYHLSHYDLAAVIFNRVFAEDKFNITHRECSQWIQYMQYAGVQHIYWYDTAHSNNESQQEHLNKFVEAGVLTYHRFYSLFPKIPGTDFHYEQDSSYKHFIKNYNTSLDWVIEMDVDEYPFSPSDTGKGFLQRYIQSVKESQPTISQILLQCMIFGGNPTKDSHGWIIERYQRRKKYTEGTSPGFSSRQKPLFQPRLCTGVSEFDPHSFIMKNGETIVGNAEEIRMNHYWGPRITDFGPDTPEVDQMLVVDESIQSIADELRKGR